MFWFLLLAVVLITWFHLRGEDLSPYDWPRGESFSNGEPPSEEHRAVVQQLSSGMGALNGGPRRERLARVRNYLDSMSDGRDLDATFKPVDASGVAAEWVLAPGADPDRRVLYIHGGAFMMGSPKSHRNITSNFSRVARAAVLAIDYRLMPEHSRKAGIADCRQAYRWLVNNGPDGPAAADRIFVAGDSAGGNLTLSLTGWLRSQPLRQPDAAVALSPLTDATLVSPSWITNRETDAMLGPIFGRLAKVPRPLLWWVSWFQNRITPRDPSVSPAFGDLSGLPPTLVQASEAEMLLDDARRYANKAVAHGSSVKLQTWPHVVHVWQIFYPELTEARQAWEQIEAFVAEIDASK